VSNPDSARVGGPARDRDESLPHRGARRRGCAVADRGIVTFVPASRCGSLRLALGSSRPR